MKTFSITLAMSLALLSASTLEAQTYVNQAAIGLNDGSSWVNAYTSLHDALDSYSVDDELWVAAGTYLPGESSAWSGAARTTFYIHQNVKLYGGFNGTEISLDLRDPIANPTILSGDVNGDDDPNDLMVNRADNELNVVFVSGAVDTNTVIDGFQIAGGHAAGSIVAPEDQRGGGLWCLGSPQIINCHFRENYSGTYGGGLYLRNALSADAIVQGCVFENNLTEIGGGGMTVSTGGNANEVEVSNCQFIDNSSNFAGAGLYVFVSSVTVDDCQFNANTAMFTGGGLYFSLQAGDTCAVTTSAFEFNVSSNGGACTISNATNLASSSVISFVDCDFIENHASILATDSLNDGGAIFLEYVSSGSDNVVSLESCYFQGNSARVGGGINSIHFSGMNNQLNINDCLFLDNPASDGGGLQIWELGGAAIRTSVRRSIFSGNTGGYFQAMAQINQSPDPDSEMEVVNCLFYENGAAEPNKSVLATSGIMSVQSCTFSANESTAINLRDSGQLTIQNTILDGLSNPVIVVDVPTDAVLTSNGGNLISDDSMNGWLHILDQSETTTDFALGTYLLTETSPAVDAGVILGDIPEFDLAGTDRVQGGCIDIGAYESSFDSGSGCASSLFENIDESTRILVMPNPVTDAARLSIANDWRGEIQLSVVDMLGRTVYSSVLVKADDKLLIELDFHELPESTFYLLISNDERIAVSSFVKL